MPWPTHVTEWISFSHFYFNCFYGAQVYIEEALFPLLLASLRKQQLKNVVVVGVTKMRRAPV
jgi:hypothetical protein